MRFRRHAVVAASCFWLSVLPAAAQWAQCASDLVELREVARAVQESADRVASIETAVRSGEEAYARCVEDRQNFNADPQTNPFPGAIQGAGSTSLKWATATAGANSATRPGDQ